MAFRGVVVTGMTAAVVLMALPAQAAPTCAKVKCIALTFDDGPGTETGALLSLFRKERVKATFFLVGKHVERRPALVKRMAREGHEIGNHSWSHASLPTLFDEQVTQELLTTQEAIASVTGRPPRLFRPPYGHTDDRVLGLAKDAGLAQVLWSGTTLDWKLRDQKKIKAVILKLARRDGVILMHDTVPQTVQVMPEVIEELKKRGYHLVTVSTLLKGRRLAAGESYPAAP
ncbi:polysaccharide deacetylase family protein [Nonomuraea africana]|uniref:polysaccharide deacetylase family protein n=1 Tax=Nonomuraea africana TaxID=46171 RepID=UPI0033F5BDB5